MSIDTRTAEEKAADETLAFNVDQERRSWEAKRAELESDFSTAKTDQVRKWLRQMIGKCDRALMECSAGRLPEFDVNGHRN